jgi:exoribonuclease-2
MYVPSKVIKNAAKLVEFLDQGRLRAGLIVREQGERIALLQADGREKLVHRDLILLHHAEKPNVEPATLAAAITELEHERAHLAGELDLKLLWEVVREQARGFSAAELAELFFGKRSAVTTSVVLEALLNDRLYFTRRHLEFVAESAERVERLRLQQERTRLKSESNRKLQALLRATLSNQAVDADETAPIIEQLRQYLENPATRSADLTTLLNQAAADLSPAEVAYEVLERLGQAPDRPRYVAVGGLPRGFSTEALAEAEATHAPVHSPADALFTVSIDDEETVEIDDALSCQTLPDGRLRVLTHIALVADWVPRGGPMDREAMERASTVYLPEATVRMLPDVISCDRASLIAGAPRSVLTTDVELAADGTLLRYRIYPATLTVSGRLTYHEADRLLANPDDRNESAALLQPLAAMALRLRDGRRRAGATLITRRETKIRVRDGHIELGVIDTSSPSRLMVAEYMVLANHLAARFASENHIPIIYRTQAPAGGDLLAQHPRLSLFPAFHSGIGLSCYAQLSSPIRRYADLVLQRQLMCALGGSTQPMYQSEDLLAVLANAESADTEAKELERRAKRYWALRFLEQLPPDRLLDASAFRDGATAELTDYAVRGTLRNAPNLPNQARIKVRIASLDPLRGWFAMEYAGPATA